MFDKIWGIIKCFFGFHIKKKYWLDWNEKHLDGIYYRCIRCGKILRKLKRNK